jgi:hypothetical protein
MLTIIALLAAAIVITVVANFKLHFFKLDLLDKLQLPERAKDSSGKFIKDDPTTQENEAWVNQPPPKKPRKPYTRKQKTNT